MRITENRLRRIIRSAIKETIDHPEYGSLQQMPDGSYMPSDIQSKMYRKQEDEANALNDAGNLPGHLKNLKEGDQVRVLHVDRPYSGTRPDWGGVMGIVDSIDQGRGVCTIIDLSGQLRPLVDCPMTDEYLKAVSSDSSGIDNIRDHMSDTVNQDMPMESVLRRVIRKELKRR